MFGGLKKIYRKFRIHFDREYDIKCLRKKGAKIGNRCSFGDSYIDPGFPFLIEIGNDVTLSCAGILAHDGSTQKVCKKSRVGKVVIGNNVFIGYRSIVLPTVHIGNNVIIGAGSVVTKNIPDNSVAAGNPCKVIGSYEEFKRKHKDNLLSHPVYPTYHTLKSSEEIAKMQRELVDTWGYDE